jgi:hypothetical protein
LGSAFTKIPCRKLFGKNQQKFQCQVSLDFFVLSRVRVFSVGTRGFKNTTGHHKTGTMSTKKVLLFVFSIFPIWFLGGGSSTKSNLTLFLSLNHEPPTHHHVPPPPPPQGRARLIFLFAFCWPLALAAGHTPHACASHVRCT